MKVLVLVSQVPAKLEFARLDKRTGRLEFEPERLLNPVDVHVLSEAVRLKEEHGATFELLAASSEANEDAVREALAYGAAGALVLTGPHVGGADGVGLGVAFAAAIRHLGKFDAILLAASSPAPEWGLVAGSLADALEMPLVVDAAHLRPGPKWTCESALGRDRWGVEVQGAVVATISDRVPKRHPTAWGVVDAVHRTIVTKPLHELDADGTLLPRLAARAVLKRQSLERKAKAETETFADDPEDGARLVARRLKNKGLWPEASR